MVHIDTAVTRSLIRDENCCATSANEALRIDVFTNNRVQPTKPALRSCFRRWPRALALEHPSLFALRHLENRMRRTRRPCSRWCHRWILRGRWRNWQSNIEGGHVVVAKHIQESRVHTHIVAVDETVCPRNTLLVHVVPVHRVSHIGTVRDIVHRQLHCTCLANRQKRSNHLRPKWATDVIHKMKYSNRI